MSRRRSKFIVNETAVAKPWGLQHITANLSGSSAIRHDTLEGRQYTVAPVVLLTEGVHEGSDGPLYYSAAENEKSVLSWNWKPLVVYHPKRNGQAVSASDTAVINTRKCGMLLNTRHDSKLRADAWFEDSRINAVDDRIQNFLESQTQMEVSTGLGVDVEEVEGNWQGEQYVGIARNYRPDHLALLPDQIGACSIAKGGGLFQLNEQGFWAPKDIPLWLKDKKFITLEMSHNQTAQALSSKLRDKLGNKWEGWLEEVWDDYLVYWNDGKLFRHSYLSNTNEVELSGDPEEVTRVTNFRLVSDGSLIGNQLPLKEENEMDKKAMIDALIANSATGYIEADRVHLNGLPDATVKMVYDKTVKLVANNATTTTAAPVENTATTTTAAPVQNAQTPPPRVLTTEEYIAAAPVGIREVLNSGLTVLNAERNRLVSTVLANGRCPFTEEYLKARSTDELKGLAILAASHPEPQVQNSFLGQGFGQFVPVLNQHASDEEPLVPRDIDWSK